MSTNETEKVGLRDSFTMGSDYNQLDFIIEQKIRSMVNTAALVRIDSCTSTGSGAAAGACSATPLVCQTDADGNALDMASIPSMPHYRIQSGNSAIVLDPTPGDIGVAVFCKSDSSTVTTGTTTPQRPGSYRCFDQADGMIVASVSNQAPENYIELDQAKTIVIHAPEGCTIETDQAVTIIAKSVTVEASDSITLDTPLVTVTGQIVQTGEKGSSGGSSFTGGFTNTGGTISSNGVVLETHVHSGVDSGSDNTGAPVT